MNYRRHYDRLIERARNRVLSGYVERHHVLPRCMGGGNESSNLVQLTAEEHYVAHQLLHKMHPDVKKGKKTEDDVLCEFLDTFEMHYSLNHEGSRDGKISMDEWIEYYNNVSMSIDDDKYFELMMNSAWNLDNSRVTKKGWGGEF